MVEPGAPPVPTRLRIRGEPVPGAGPALERRLPGERIRARVRLRPPAGWRNPGMRRSGRALERAGIAAEVRLAHPSLHVRLPQRERLRPLRGLHRARAAWGDRLAAAGPGGGLLRALALGDRRDLRRGERRAFARLGIAHLLAVSGLHLALVAALAYRLAAAVARRSARLCAHFDTRSAALAWAFACAVAYAGLAGFGVPVRRALLLLAGVAGAVVGRRPRALLPPLSAAAMAVLAAAPEALFAAGPQLSFAASLALALSLRRRPGGSGAAVAAAGWGGEALRASASAVAATAPLVALHLGQVAPFALVVNLVAIPWTAFALLPAAAAALLAATLPVGPVSDALLAAACLPARATSGAVVALSEVLPGPAAVPRPAGLVWILAGAGVAASLIARRTGTRVALAAAVTALLAAAPPAAVAPPPPRAVFLDVGQGDAIVIQTAGAAVVVDAGSAFPGGGDAGEAAVLPALAALGIRRLDLAVVSHADGDHQGGMPTVLRALPVGEVWLPYGGLADPSFAALRAAARSRGVPVHERGAGAPALAVGGLRVVPLWPPRRSALPSRNDRSLVVRVEAGSVRLLLPGDLEAASEAALAASGVDLRAELLKLPHHGSRTSSTAPFLEAVAADVGIASAPFAGRFEMPHPSVVRRAIRGGASLWWTGRDGAVMASLDAPLAVWGFARPRRGARSDSFRYHAPAARPTPAAGDGADRP